MDIKLDDVNELDEVWIRTEQSNYHFLLTDPGLLKGRLRGGVLGDQEYQAVFCGALISSDVSLENPLKLKTGGRAVFYVARESGVNRLVTSAITALTYTRQSRPVDDC